MPKFDPVAAFEVRPVEVAFSGVGALRFPALPASRWLPPLMDVDVMGILKLSENRRDVTKWLLMKQLTADALQAAINTAVERASGRTWWSAMVLASSAKEHWHVIGGDLARSGIRWAEVPLGAALDAIYNSFTRSMDEKALTSFQHTLDNPRTGPVERDPRLTKLEKMAPPLPATSLQYVQTRPKTRPRKPQDRQAEQIAAPIQPRGLPVDSGQGLSMPS